ncbi:MAG: hypothetical protein WCO44_12835 [Bacteroidota bacterium]
MNIYLAIAVLLGSGFLCKNVFSKAFKDRERGPVRKRIINQSVAAVFEKTGEFLLLAGKTYLVVVLVLLTLRLCGFGLSANQFIKLQHTIAFISSALKPVSGWMGTLVLLVAITAVLVIVYRRKKAECTGWSQKQFNEILQQYKDGTLPEITPTREMNEITAKISEIIQWYENLQHEGYSRYGEAVESYRKRAIDDIKVLKNLYIRIDIERRINLKEEEDEPRSVKRSVLMFFTSLGFYETVTKVKGLLGKTITAIGLVALLVVEVHQSATVFSKNMEMDLMVKRVKEAREQLSQGSGISSRPLSADDEKILDAMAADFELSVGCNPVWGVDGSGNKEGPGNRDPFLLQSLVVRENILDHFVSTIGPRANSKDFGTSRSLADPAFHDPGGYPIHLIKAHLEQFSTTGKPQTELGREYRTVMRDKVARVNPEKWNKVKGKFLEYRKSFSKPLTLKSATGKLWCSITSDVTDNLARFGNNELGKAANDIVKDIGKENLKIIHDNLIYRHISSVCSTTPYADAWNDINSMSRTAIFPDEDIAMMVHNRLPNLEPVEIRTMAENYNPGLVNSRMPVNETRAKKAVADLRIEGLNENQALRTFDDYFPAQNTDFTRPLMETKPCAGEEEAIKLKTLLKEGYLERDIAAAARSTGGFFQAFRARSIMALRGFNRIGGVLIGELPQDSVNVNITGFSWNQSGNNVSFTFQNSNGERSVFGPYPPDIVLNALVYAADGRPTTATMVTAPPFRSLKILLHPALVNSQTGLDAIEIDRWVDTYENQQVKDERNFAYLIQELYAMTNYYRIFLIKKQDSGIEIVRHHYRNTIGMDNATFRLLAGKTLTYNNCPFYAKSQLYDPEVVTLLKACMDRKPETMARLNEMIIAKVKERWQGADITQQYRLSRLLGRSESFKMNEYAVWSGVREVPYTMATNLKIKPQPGKSKVNYPFNFIVQTAYFTETSDESGKESEAEFIDKNPWQFPLLEMGDVVNRCVADALNKQGARAEILHRTFTRMSQFTELQRLFRLAFEGRLGFTFPLPELLEVARQFDHSVPCIKTPEWNYNPYDGLTSALDTNFRSLMEAVNLKR